ncbi:hypothetical protein Tco_0188441, partial [Tanacetum coccineum]
ADNIMLVSESAKGLNNRLENLREVLEDNGLRNKSRRIGEDISHRIKAAWMEWKAATRVLCNRNGGSGGIENAKVIPNGVYRVELKVKNIINKMREGWLRWFGHVRRRPQLAPVRRVEALVVDDLRRIGTSRELELD